jgi:hypothetical protein
LLFSYTWVIETKLVRTGELGSSRVDELQRFSRVQSSLPDTLVSLVYLTYRRQPAGRRRMGVAGSPGELQPRSGPAARGHPEAGAPVRFSGMLAS